MRRSGRFRQVRNLMAVAALALAAMLSTPGPASAGPLSDPDLCRNGGGSGYLSCNGKDPNSMGCTGVSTKASVKAKNGVFIELRYSTSCQAYWTRYTNTPGSTGEARIKGNSVTYKKTLAGYAGETGWTPMAAANQSPEACLFFYYAPFGEYLESCAS
ncbi:DUF2690 domain-containing protein [Micromonospora echinofusca]|uniref:DUF2690 domain-containing protein n=2 Tax=Micromonospora echinofusca TaxID=47858 RepID=UPI0037BD094C